MYVLLYDIITIIQDLSMKKNARLEKKMTLKKKMNFAFVTKLRSN